MNVLDWNGTVGIDWFGIDWFQYVNSGTDVSEGSEVDCVILHVDISDKCVEVSLEPQLVKAVQKRQEKTCEVSLSLLPNKDMTILGTKQKST